jgi:predicted AAA+ superfamily ATPase
MEPISEIDIRARLLSDNPWWSDPSYTVPESLSAKRVYFEPFKTLALNFGVRRATVLLGPRRVGKTYMAKQLIQVAMQSGISGSNILYVSIDSPIYLGRTLQKFIEMMPASPSTDQKLVIFDEIQYLRDWESYLKDLVDTRANTKFVVSGSAAAALQLQSRESGAGRFSDFMLPPLTFYEFLSFLGEGEAFIRQIDEQTAKTNPRYEILDIKKLNSRFVDYLNFGGYPEAVLNEEVRKNAEQFIKNDIIDKVLLNDLPSLYGINNPPILKKLFAFLAYNAGSEASFENICKGSGIPKPTIRTYLEYLESAFLIMKLPTIDENCKTLQRERNFKIYLNNPSMRAAFFAPVKEDDTTRIGLLAECAVFSQWQHSNSFQNLRYARWKEGEVDIVYLMPEAQKPSWIGEIKWSDRFDKDRAEETKHLSTLMKKHKSVKNAVFTTRTIESSMLLEGRSVWVYPTAAYCYILGRNITASELPTLNTPQTVVETA